MSETKESKTSELRIQKKKQEQKTQGASKIHLFEEEVSGNHVNHKPPSPKAEKPKKVAKSKPSEQKNFNIIEVFVNEDLSDLEKVNIIRRMDIAAVGKKLQLDEVLRLIQLYS